MIGKNFTLEVNDINIDTSNLYEKEGDKRCIALIDTDSNYINLEPLWMFLKEHKHYDFIIKNIKKVVDLKFPKFNSKGNKDDFEHFVQFHDKLVIDPVVNNTLDKFSKTHNLMNIGDFKHPNIDLTFEYEDTLKYDLVLAKKKYAKVIYGDTKIKFTGLETKKTNSSQFVRNELAKFFEFSLGVLDKYGKTEEANYIMNDELNKVKKNFLEISKTGDMEYVGEPCNVKTFNKYTKFDENGKASPIKGTPQNVKALINYHNFMKIIKDKNLPKARQGQKIIRWAVNPNNKLGVDIVGFPAGYETQFMKYFKDYFKVNYKNQWKVKAGGIVGRFYDVIKFDETKSSKRDRKRRKFK